MPAKFEPLDINGNTTIQVTNSAHTQLWALYAGVYWWTIHKNIHLAQPRTIAVHVFGRTHMLFTKTPAQKGAVHKIARPEPRQKLSLICFSRWRLRGVQHAAAYHRALREGFARAAPSPIEGRAGARGGLLFPSFSNHGQRTFFLRIVLSFWETYVRVVMYFFWKDYEKTEENQRRSTCAKRTGARKIVNIASVAGVSEENLGF